MTSDNIPAFRMVVLCALSLSIGWGIRGNFGHEYGAMIPGALAAIAAVVMSGREDWWRRVGYFGMFGALGWSFGGSISYMMVIGYTHSGHLPSQVYGFACLFVIGFIWGALGGAGTALPACLDRERLTGLFPPIMAVLSAWLLGYLLIPRFVHVDSGAMRHEAPLYWYDTNWIAALMALVAALIFAAFRRRIDWGTSLILHLAIGWWVGFLFMVFMVDVLGIEFRMTPPRGDNWAGASGMTVSLLIYCVRKGLLPVAHAALVSGIVGGFGFATAAFLKLVEMKYVPPLLSHFFGPSAWQANWHSILEQTYGLINGIGIALAMIYLARRLPRIADEPRVWRWTEVFAIGFVLLLITYVNIVKNVPNWVQLNAMPAELYDLRSRIWFDAGYVSLSIAVLALLARHLSAPIALVPERSLGKAQLLYVVFLWWVVIGNLMRAIPPFNAQRLITEGVIHVNAVLCTLMVLIWPRQTALPEPTAGMITSRSLVGLSVAGLLLLGATVAVESYGVREMYGDTYVKQAGGYHTRFGPDAKTGKPKKGEKHP
jgi:hypothetical protein